MPLSYPPPPTSDAADDYHGTRVPDPFRPLEDPRTAETQAWIAAQNALTHAWLREVPARDEIRGRLRAVWNHPRAGAPWRRADRWFQLRNTGLQNQDVLWVADDPDDAGHVLLDPNTLSEDGTVSLSALAVAPDARLLAFAMSDAGTDWMTWRVLRVDDGSVLEDVVEWSKFSSAAWAPDGCGFYYARYDAPPAGQTYEAPNRDMRLHFHRLGDAQADDRVVHERPDEPEWGFAPTVSDDGRWLIVHVWHGTDPRNRVALADATTGEDVRYLLDDGDASYEFVGNDADVLYFLTDADAPRGRVVAIEAHRPHRTHWREIIPQSHDTLEQVRLVGGRFVAVTLHHGAHRVALHSHEARTRVELPLPRAATVGAVTGRQDDVQVHFTVTTFTDPVAVWRHDLAAATTTAPRAAGDDRGQARHVTEQVFVTSGDGTLVPMFLVRDAAVQRDRNRPVLLYGYGGFNVPLTPTFKPEWAVWLELGGVLAVANLRGGGEYGREWHDAGRLAHKQNVFDDFAACAQWLVDEGWTCPQRLAISGRSNGGLLTGASLTQRPELFGAAVVEVGVLDMLRFHTFTIGWAWTSDYGCADDAEQFAWLYAYSPLHNLVPGRHYPATLITTGDHDDRVVPAHSLKFAAALQAAQGRDAPVLLRVDTAAGHGAGKPTEKLIEERADVLAFLTRVLAVPSPAASLRGSE